VAAVCSAVGVAAEARAADDASGGPGAAESRAPRGPRTGFQTGVRVGYTYGLGVVYHGLNLSDASSGALPVLVDAGWRVLPELYLGVYGQYAPVFLKTYALTCQSGWSCTAQDYRFGVQGDYHFLPQRPFDPYVGLGAGYEILHSSFDGSTVVPQGATYVRATLVEDFTDRGWEFASLTAGFDWRFSETFGVGPFLLGTVGEYNTQSGAITIRSGTQQQPEPVQPIQMAAHALVFVGVRGTFNL
jgi:opacity protein-like surface antigen